MTTASLALAGINFRACPTIPTANAFMDAAFTAWTEDAISDADVLAINREIAAWSRSSGTHIIKASGLELQQDGAPVGFDNIFGAGP